MNKGLYFSTRQKSALTILNIGIVLLGAAMVSDFVVYTYVFKPFTCQQPHANIIDLVHVGPLELRLRAQPGGCRKTVLMPEQLAAHDGGIK